MDTKDGMGNASSQVSVNNQPEIFVVKRKSNLEFAKTQGRIKSLEKLLAIELKRAAELLKENTKLETELEKTRKQRDCWRKLYRKIRPDEKALCDRDKAMAVSAMPSTPEA